MKNHRINQERVARSKPKSKKFRKPTSAMVQEYATSLEQPAFDAGKFVDYYESNGWRVGGKGSMKCWKAAVRNWIRTGGTQSKGGKPTVGADSDQAWQSLKQILRKIDKTKPYRELIRKQLKPEVYRAAETVGFSQLFSIDQFNESKLLAAFSTALGEKIR